MDHNVTNSLPRDLVPRDLVPREPRDRETVYNFDQVYLPEKQTYIKKFKRKAIINNILAFCLSASLLGNVILIGTNIHFSSNPNDTNAMNDTIAINGTFTMTSLEDLPYNNTCLLETSFGYVKKHIYAHICYIPGLHTSFIDLRFEKDGKITMDELKRWNFHDINGDWTIA